MHPSLTRKLWKQPAMRGTWHIAVRERDMACVSGGSHPTNYSPVCAQQLTFPPVTGFTYISVTGQSYKRIPNLVLCQSRAFFFLTHRGSAPPSVGSEDSRSCAGSSKGLHCLCCAEGVLWSNLRYLEGSAGTHLSQAVRECSKQPQSYEDGQAGLHKRGCSVDGSQVRTGKV